MTANAASTRRAERRWVFVGLAVVGALLALEVVGGLIRDATSDEPSVIELVQKCLTERSTPYDSPEDDPVAASAGRGALRTTVDGNPVTVSLGTSEDDAERVYQAYLAVAPADVVTRLERNRKVVYLWQQPPTTEQRDFVVLCTLDAQN